MRPKRSHRRSAGTAGARASAASAALFVLLVALAASPWAGVAAAQTEPADSAPPESLSLGGGPEGADSAPWEPDEGPLWESDSLVFEDFPEDDYEWPYEVPAEGVTYYPYLAFNRVDGWTFGGHFGCRPTSGWLPRYAVRVAVASDRGHQGIYQLEIAQPVLPGRRLLLGWQLRRWTDGMEGDDERVGVGENFAAAFLFRRDYRDYLERDGTSFFAEAAPLSWLSATAIYASLQNRSLPDETPNPGTVFRTKSPWRSNPAADEGKMNSGILEIVLDRRDDDERPRRGGWLRLQCEASGPGLDSDFTFTRYLAEARGYLPLTVGMNLKTRLLAGTTGAGTLPFQKQFAVGGISTLRGHSYKHHRGDHVFLANAEYDLQVWRGRQRSGIRADVRLLAFADVGQAWTGPRYDLAHRQMMADIGFGVGLADERIRLYAAHDLRDSKSGLLWTLRLDNPF